MICDYTIFQSLSTNHNEPLEVGLTEGELATARLCSANPMAMFHSSLLKLSSWTRNIAEGYYVRINIIHVNTRILYILYIYYIHIVYVDVCMYYTHTKIISHCSNIVVSTQLKRKHGSVTSRVTGFCHLCHHSFGFHSHFFLVTVCRMIDP